MSIVGRLLGTQKKSKSSWTDFFQSLYPEEVRYALQHKGAQMGKVEIKSLLNSYVYEALYLTIKALGGQREQQRHYIDGLTCLFMQPDYTEERLKGFLRPWIEELPPDKTVNGAKLAQLTRSGSQSWQKRFEQLAESVYAESENVLPCLVAFTTMLGYNQFVKVFSRRPNATISILVPDWMADPDEEWMGYEVSLGYEPGVALQSKDKCLVGGWDCMKLNCRLNHHFCSSALFIDDTINTGSTSDKLTSFWKTEYGLNVPPERVRVITDLRA